MYICIGYPNRVYLNIFIRLVIWNNRALQVWGYICNLYEFKRYVFLEGKAWAVRRRVVRELFISFMIKLIIDEFVQKIKLLRIFTAVICEVSTLYTLTMTAITFNLKRFDDKLYCGKFWGDGTDEGPLSDLIQWRKLHNLYGDKCHGKILCLDQHFSTERNAMY